MQAVCDVLEELVRDGTLRHYAIGGATLRTMIAVSDIQKMSQVERLQTMELLWKSLSGSASEYPSPS